MAATIGSSNLNKANTGHKQEKFDATQSVGGYLVKTDSGKL